MSISVNVKISGTVGLSAGPFDIYHTPINPSNDGTLVISGVSRATLLGSGQPITVPNGTTTIRVRSTGTCTFYDDEVIPIPTPTPTNTPTPTPTPTAGVYNITIRAKEDITTNETAVTCFISTTSASGPWTTLGGGLTLTTTYQTFGSTGLTTGQVLYIALQRGATDITFAEGFGSTNYDYCGKNTPYTYYVSYANDVLSMNVEAINDGFFYVYNNCP